MEDNLPNNYVEEDFDHAGDAFYSDLDRLESGIELDAFPCGLEPTVTTSGFMRVASGSVWKNPLHERTGNDKGR